VSPDSDHREVTTNMKVTRGFRQRVRIMMPVLVMFLTMSIAGCETFGPKYHMARSAIAPLDNEKGRIVFYRPVSFLWYGYRERPDIFVDDKKVGTSRPGTLVCVDVEPGRHRVTIPATVYIGHETLY